MSTSADTPTDDVDDQAMAKVRRARSGSVPLDGRSRSVAHLRRLVLGTDRRVSNTEFVWLALVIGVVLAAVGTIGDRGWVPVGDDAVVVTRAGDVLSGDPPLLGMPTSLPADSGEHTHHPGPLLFVWLAPFVAAFGRVTGGALGAAAANVSAVAAIWWFGREMLGKVAGIALGTVGLLVAAAVGSVYLPLNSSISAAATFATLVTAWAVLVRVPGAAFALVWFASWCAQSHIAYGVVAATVAVPVLVWEVHRRWRATRQHPLGETAGVLAPLPVFTMVLWIGPLLDGGRNLRRLLGAEDASGLPSWGPGQAIETIVAVLGRWPFTRRRQGLFGWSPTTRDAEVLLTDAVTPSSMIVVCLGAALLVWAWRRRVAAARAGVVVLVLALLGTFVGVAVSPQRDPLNVQLYWARCVSLFALALYVVAARPVWLPLVRSRVARARPARNAAGLVVLVIVIAIGLRLSGPRWPYAERVLAEQMTTALASSPSLREPELLALVARGGATPGAAAAEQSVFGAAAHRLEADRPTIMDAEWYWGLHRSARGHEKVTPSIVVTPVPLPQGTADGWTEVAAVVPLRLSTPELSERVAAAALSGDAPLALVPGAEAVVPTVVDGLLPGTCEDPAEWVAEPSRFATDAPRALVELYRAGLVASPPLPEELDVELWSSPLEGLWAYWVEGAVPQELAANDRLVLNRLGCRG